MLGQEPARALPGQTPLRAFRAPARSVGVGTLLAGAVLFGGCAGVAEVTGTATQGDVVHLRADVTALQTSVRQMKSHVDAMGPQADGRLRDQVAEVEGRTAAVTGRLDGLATTLTELTTRVDELTSTVETLNRRLRAGPPPVPGALPPLATPAPSALSRPTSPVPPASAVPPSSATAAPATPPAPGSTAAPAPGSATPQTAPPAVASIPPPGARPSTGALQPQDVYQAAYIDFSKGAYELAINEFRDFLRRYPEHPLASSAQYWIGEAHLSLARGHADAGRADEAARARQQAVQEFRKVIANYPRGDKAPSALYKEALVLLELKQPDLAQARLQYLIDNFPQAEETPLARERLTALKDR
ncbi:MAG: outer membrane protein assembly factor BamD [Candidatus Rokuibacteriota bacterium]